MAARQDWASRRPRPAPESKPSGLLVRSRWPLALSHPFRTSERKVFRWWNRRRCLVAGDPFNRRVMARHPGQPLTPALRLRAAGPPKLVCFPVLLSDRVTGPGPLCPASVALAVPGCGRSCRSSILRCLSRLHSIAVGCSAQASRQQADQSPDSCSAALCSVVPGSRLPLCRVVVSQGT